MDESINVFEDPGDTTGDRRADIGSHARNHHLQNRLAGFDFVSDVNEPGADAKRYSTRSKIGKGNLEWLYCAGVVHDSSSDLDGRTGKPVPQCLEASPQQY